jgi:protein-arginine kinase activator protein McsA
MEWKHASVPPTKKDQQVTGSIEIYSTTHCKPCGDLFEKDQFCPFCYHVYKKDSDIELFTCSQCNRCV